MENQFLSGSELESLLSAGTSEDVQNRLRTKSMCATTEKCDNEKFLFGIESNLWSFINEIVPDLSFFRVFLLKKDFSNLKFAIKGVISNIAVDEYFDSFGSVKPEEIYSKVKQQKFSLLPDFMQSVAEKAFSVLLKTGDACLSDAVIDSGMFLAMKEACKKEKILEEYVEALAVYANINISLRSINFSKNNKKFLSKTLIPCNTFDLEKLSAVTVEGKDSLLEYFSGVSYSGLPAFVYNENPYNLNNWFDYSVYCLAKKGKSSCFGLAPVFSYVLLKFLEIKNIRMIFANLSAPQGLSVLKDRFRLFA